MTEETLKPGDRVQILHSGGNNSSAPEYELDKALDKSNTVYEIKEIKRGGKYNGCGGGTVILTTGQPMWETYCTKVKDVIINNYQIF